MPRYKVNIRFGPWVPGEEFESEDELHAKMAAEGRYLKVVAEEES